MVHMVNIWSDRGDRGRMSEAGQDGWRCEDVDQAGGRLREAAGRAVKQCIVYCMADIVTIWFD